MIPKLVALLLLAAVSATLQGQIGPVVSSYHLIDSAEPALAGLLDSGDRFGRDFNPLGDLDLDGVPDFLVGARSDDDGATDAGAVYILLMNSDGSVKTTSKISATSGGLAAAGVSLTASQFFGYSVTTVGDLDGDSVQDIAVGARRGGGASDGGAVFIVFLNRDGSVKSVQPITATLGNLGHTLASTDFFGESATFLGTIDGAPTLAVANAADDDGGNNRGSIFILRLNPDGTAMTGQTVKISSTSGGFGTGLANGDQFGGRDITPLGDIDGDGNLDIAVGAFGSDGGQGALWVLRLNADFTVKAKQKISEGSGGFQAILNADDDFGHAVTAPGDIDGDGIPDLITSANRSDLGGTDMGEVYILLLNSDGSVKEERRYGATSGNLPFALPNMGRFGRVLSILGDLAGDGTLCLAVGGGAGQTGSIYLLFLTLDFSPLLSDPRAIGGNVLWLDGSDVDGDFMRGGSFINEETWVDKSSASNADATQALSSRTPSINSEGYNGLTTVCFDGDDFMDVDPAAFGILRNTTGATIFAVTRPTQAPSGQAYRVFMVSSGTSSASTRAGFSLFDGFGTGLAGSGDGALNGRRLDTDSYQRINGGSALHGDFVQWTGEFDYAHGGLRLYEDGTLITSSAAFQTAGNTSDTASLNIRLGADASLSDLRGFFDGEIAELIVYDRVLLGPERLQIEQWLSAKWSVPELELSLDETTTTLSWPVTPEGWTLETSADLTTFSPPTSSAVRTGNRNVISEPDTGPKHFFRLTRKSTQ